MRNYYLFIGIFMPFLAFAQPQSTPADMRLQGFEQRKTLLDNSLLRGLPFKSIGPTVMSGRITDLAVNPQDPTEFWVAYASGGLWQSTNHGLSFDPKFDHEAVMTIGDFDIHWPTKTIWLGTGEVNSSRSSYSGVGMYRSNDEGKTWQHMGLAETHHIGRVAIHPTNPDIVWVAALGHLYSKNAERGIFMTTDGGRTWQHPLFVSDSTGAIDLVLDPQNPNILYAATWERDRKAWNLKEAGAESAIYKSTDGGVSWSLVTADNSGFPTGTGIGRIGLDVVVAKGKTSIFAVVDNQNSRPKTKEIEKYVGITTDQMKKMTREDVLALDTAALATFLKHYDYPPKYSQQVVRERLKKHKLTPVSLVEYLGDANTALFDTDVIGPEVYRSDDNGTTWKRVHTDYIDNCFNTYGYYFAQIRVTPGNPDDVYIMGVPLLHSTDGGQTWTAIDGDNGHADHHALWINPNRKGHLINGNDGGVHITYDYGKNWQKCNSPAVGQFYAVAVDDANPYRVYGGLQDNGVWFADHTAEVNTEWHATGHNPYKSIMGGDGMQIAIDPRDNNTVYTGFQFGFYYRQLRTGSRLTSTRPEQDLGDEPLRFNWQTPIHLSKHQPDVLYMGTQRLYRSLNQGKQFEAISDDLTHGAQKGDVPFGTISTIHESPLKFGLLYAGTDDGYVHVSKSGGETWTRISDSLPQGLWCSRVQASAHERARVYVTLNGYRNDHFDSYVYRSEDYGANWTRIFTDLPAEPVNVIREDPENPNLLFVGTDQGLYASVDGGESTMAMHDTILPQVAVHDLVIQPREHHLIVGTHGRSLYLTDITFLEKLTDTILAKQIHVFDVDALVFDENWGSKDWTWAQEAYIPEWRLPVFTQKRGKATITISSDKGELLSSESATLGQGLQYIDIVPKAGVAYENSYKKLWGKAEVRVFKDNQLYLPAGQYSVKIKTDQTTATVLLKVKAEE